MRIVVTGSSGHVGGAIARHLHAQNHDVVGVSRSHATQLPDAIIQHDLDVGAPDFIPNAETAISACDAVVHAAACLDESPDNTEVSRVNCLGTQQVIMLAQQLGATCVVYISGLNILGTPQQHPITEQHPIAPGNIYAASKHYGEQLTTYANSASMRTVSLRVSSPVGPGLTRRRIFSLFVENALHNRPLVLNGAGTRRQDYVDVRDVAHAVAAVVVGNACGIFNIASAQPVSNLELARRCVAALNSSSPIRFSNIADPQDTLCWDLSIEKARAAWGYTPSVTLAASIRGYASEQRTK